VAVLLAEVSDTLCKALYPCNIMHQVLLVVLLVMLAWLGFFCGLDGAPPRHIMHWSYCRVMRPAFYMLPLFAGGSKCGICAVNQYGQGGLDANGDNRACTLCPSNQITLDSGADSEADCVCQPG